MTNEAIDRVTHVAQFWVCTPLTWLQCLNTLNSSHVHASLSSSLFSHSSHCSRFLISLLTSLLRHIPDVPALQGYETRQDHGHGREQREDDERAVVYESGVDRGLVWRIPASEHRVRLPGYVKGGRNNKHCNCNKHLFRTRDHRVRLPTVFQDLASSVVPGHDEHAGEVNAPQMTVPV